MNGNSISIMFFSNTLVRGGAEEHILTLLRGLDRNRFALHLVCTPEVAERIEGDLPGDVELIRLTLRKPSQTGVVLRLARILHERRIGILHSHLFYSSLFASPVGRLAGVPVIVETPHVRECWRQGWFKSSYLVDRCVGRFVDRYIAVSEANKRYLVEQKGIPAGKVVVVRNGIDLARFNPEHEAPCALKATLGFDEGDPVLVILGRLEPQKGHWILLDALADIRMEFPRTRLVCVGEGSLREELERYAGTRGLARSVQFVGYQPNVADWLALADLTVLPSLYEGLPLAAIESLAMAKPVVASAVDGTPEVVVNGETGLTVPPGDAGRLTHAIRQLLRNPEMRWSMGRVGRQRVLKQFSHEQQIIQTQELYLKAWEERGYTDGETAKGRAVRNPAEHGHREAKEAAPCAPKPRC